MYRKLSSSSRRVTSTARETFWICLASSSRHVPRKMPWPTRYARTSACRGTSRWASRRAYSSAAAGGSTLSGTIPCSRTCSRVAALASTLAARRLTTTSSPRSSGDGDDQLLPHVLADLDHPQVDRSSHARQQPFDGRDADVHRTMLGPPSALRPRWNAADDGHGCAPNTSVPGSRSFCTNSGGSLAGGAPAASHRARPIGSRRSSSSSVSCRRGRGGQGDQQHRGPVEHHDAGRGQN